MTFEVSLKPSRMGVAMAALAAVVTTALFIWRRKRSKEEHGEDTAGSGVATRGKEESWESHVKDHGPLVEIWPGTLFVLEAAGCDRGPPVRNMVVYRVPEEKEGGTDKRSRLVIYNAIAVNEKTLAEIEALGTPTVMVVPNYLHRCCAAVWKKRFPEMLVVCPSIAWEAALEVVPVDMTTDELTAKRDWTKWIHAKVIDGWGDFENVIEVELESSPFSGKKAVLVCDLLFTVPDQENAGYAERFLVWLFDSSITLPPEGAIIIPKVARLSRIFAIKDWQKAERWYRTYAKEHGRSIAAILVGHGPPVVEINTGDGCTDALVGVASQLTKPRW